MMHLSSYRHSYHLVDASPWPIFASASAFIFAVGLISSLKGNAYLLLVGLTSLALVTYGWFRDITRESLSGKHTTKVQSGLMLGMILFLMSEVMVFFSMFWGFFHASLAPTVELGGVWPPIGITSVDPWSIPLLGSIFLLGSGATCTAAHNAMVTGNKDVAFGGMVATVLLGAAFLVLQFNEYRLSEFTIADSVFGTNFLITTGLHGAHVMIGVAFLFAMTIRLYRDHFTTAHHLGLEFSLWYWHFVDVMWLMVFLSFYWWGS
jgi:cytochrome c oxidase subunit 3